MLEVAISLAIIGILTMAVIKGQDLLYQAKINKTVTQIESIKLSIENFRNTYGKLPGDYNGQELGAQNLGKGDGSIVNSTFWEHLEKAGLLTKSQSMPAIGGIFSVAFNPDNLQGHWLKLAKEDGSGLMNYKDAISFKVKIDGSSNNETGNVRIRNAKGGNIQTKEKDCIFYIEFP